MILFYLMYPFPLREVRDSIISMNSNELYIYMAERPFYEILNCWKSKWIFKDIAIISILEINSKKDNFPTRPDISKQLMFKRATLSKLDAVWKDLYMNKKPLNL